MKLPPKKTRLSDGPWTDKPEFDPRETKGLEVAASVTSPRWAQVRDGHWWAFFTNVGPDAGEVNFNVEHPYDLNFWRSPTTDGWACRHGWLIARECELCGPMPDPTEIVDEMEVNAVRSRLEGLVRDLEEK